MSSRNSFHSRAIRPDGVLGVVLLAGGLLALSACDQSPPDWKPKVIADAEAQMRARLGDPAAQFSKVQVTGDSRSGQTCGFVTATPAAAVSGGTGRFIVYIDKAAGPFFEYSIGISSIPQAQFDFQWEHDCLNEGYK